MPRGRKPIPTEIKKARGNTGHRSLPKDEPQPPVADRESNMPEGLSDEAKVCWRSLHRMLSDCQVLSVMDVPTLALYCEAYSRYEKAKREMRKPGQGMVINGLYGKKKNPWLDILDKAHDQMLKIQLEYGMTPAARTRVRTVPKAPGDETKRPGRGSSNVFSLIKGARQA